MKNRLKILLGATALLALAAAAFLALDLRVMKSSTNTNSTTASARAEEDAIQLIQPDLTGLYVNGGGRTGQALQDELEQALRGRQHVGDIQTLDAPADQMDTAQMQVRLTPRQYLWTPVYARSTYEVVVSYASNGDLSFRNSETPYFQFSGGPALQFQATYTLTDTSAGILSAPGYRHYLAEKIAAAVADTLQTEYSR